MGNLASSLYTAVSALKAQSSAVSTISNNLANSETIGYKTTDASFYTLVTGASSQYNFTGAGVIANPSQNISQQGVIVGTDNETDLAIDGDGFFVVTDGVNEDVLYYTRTGDFSADEDGYLVNSNGFYLQGYLVDQDGEYLRTPSVENLTKVEVDRVTNAARATSEMTIEANLPASAVDGDAVDVEAQIYDSQGKSHTLTLTYTRQAADNTWSMEVTKIDGNAVTAGTATGYAAISFTDTSTTPATTDTSAAVVFGGDGTLSEAGVGTLSGVSTGVSINITWDAASGVGADDVSIAYDFGTEGYADGLSQYESQSGEMEIELDSVTQNGVRSGKFLSATVNETGQVIATFDNGMSYPIYQLKLATFANADGLEALSGNIYSPTSISGEAQYQTPSEGATGSIYAGSLESSTVDTADEFSKLIVAQQAYSAATQIVEAAQELFDDLIAAKK